MGLFKWTGDVDESMPIYVTRKTADGQTGKVSWTIKSVLIKLLALNALFWPLYLTAWLGVIVAFVAGLRYLL
jgi:hypothetical protein